MKIKVSKKERGFFLNPQMEDVQFPVTTAQQFRTLCRLYQIPPSPDQCLNELNEFIEPVEQRYREDARRLLSIIPDRVTLSAITAAMKSLRTYWGTFDMLSKNHLADYFECRMGEIEDTFHALIAQLNKESETNATLQAQINAMGNNQAASIQQKEIDALKEICVQRQKEAEESKARIEDLEYVMRQARLERPHQTLYSSLTICVRSAINFMKERGVRKIWEEDSLRATVNRRIRSSKNKIKKGRLCFYPLDEIAAAMAHHIPKVDPCELREQLEEVSCPPSKLEVPREIETKKDKEIRDLSRKIFRLCRDLPPSGVKEVLRFAYDVNVDIKNRNPNDDGEYNLK